MYPFDLSFPFHSFCILSIFNLYFVYLILINLSMKFNISPVLHLQTYEINIWPLHGQKILVGR